MKSSCQKCGRNFETRAEARACSYGCTFCAACAAAMNDRCLNCSGALEIVSEVA
ncbi:MAG: DUF1272 domain-containing protein [Candidatus Cybelea sp.]